DSKIFKVDATTFEVTGPIETVSGGFRASQDGNHAYITYGGFLYRIDPATLEIVKTFNISDLAGKRSSFDWPPTISNENLIAYQTSIDGGVVVDLNTEQIVWEGTGTGNPSISPMSNYLFYAG